jgi:hypothetical protein
LRFLGFTPNPDKSYHTGLFRESCGSDCYDGIDITPFYLREWGSRSNVASHNVNGLVSISEIEGRIWERCRNLSVSARLQCVPFNLDSMSGVFIDVSHAYRRRLLRPSNSITRYRAYVTKSRMIYVGDSRTLFLWFLQKTIGSSSPREVVSSRVPTLCHKYVRKWVGWFPAVGSPDYLYWWSEFLFAAGREACS